MRSLAASTKSSEPRPLEAEKKSECAKNGKNASIEVSPEALGRVLRAHLMPAHPPTQRLGRFRVLILSFLARGFRSHRTRSRRPDALTSWFGSFRQPLPQKVRKNAPASGRGPAGPCPGRASLAWQAEACPTLAAQPSGNGQTSVMV